MKSKKFSKPPLVEAIFELRWNLKEMVQGIKIDPHYKLLVGGLYSNLKDKYPYHEPLPSSTIPDEIACYIVQHRFRIGKDRWPLFQLGPGVITLNATTEYEWVDFKNRISYLLSNLLQVYPDKANFDVSDISIRYINAITFDFNESSIFDFLSKNMKININFDQCLFKNKSIGSLPVGFDLKYIFPVYNPRGNINLRISRGKKENIESVIFELIFQATNQFVPKQNGEILEWASKAHDVIEDWFLKLIEGELERSFK